MLAREREVIQRKELLRTDTQLAQPGRIATAEMFAERPFTTNAQTYITNNLLALLFQTL